MNNLFFSVPKIDTDYKHLLTTNIREFIVIHLYYIGMVHYDIEYDIYPHYHQIENSLSNSTHILESLKDSRYEMITDGIISHKNEIIAYMEYFYEYYLHINTLISCSLINNTMNNISTVTRSILRLAVFEAVYLSIDIPLIVHEYLTVATNFSISRLEQAFINKIVQNIFDGIFNNTGHHE